MGAVLWMAVATLLLVADEFSVMLMLPELEAAFPGADVRWLLMAFAIGAALAPLFVLRTVPHWPETPVLLASLILLALFNGASAMLPPFGVLLVLRAFVGGLHGLLVMLLARTAARTGVRAQTGLTFAWFMGIVFVVPLDASLGTLMGWDGLISVISGLALFVFLPATHCLPSGPSPRLVPVGATDADQDPVGAEKWLLAAELLGSAALAAPFALGVRELRSADGANLDLWDAAVLASFSMFGPLVVVLFRKSLLFGREVALSSCIAAAMVTGVLLLLPDALKDPAHAAALIPLVVAAEYVRRLGWRHLRTRLVPAHRQNSFRITSTSTQHLGVAIGLALVLPTANFRESTLVCAGVALASTLCLVLLNAVHSRRPTR